MNQYVETYSHGHEGFKILVNYRTWRTAVLNYGQTTNPEYFNYIEKHRETDEVFVLLKGKAYLAIGGDVELLELIEVFPMDLCKTYNIKKNVWHGVIMSKDASIYLVEEANTGKENSSYHYLSEDEKEKILRKIIF